MSDRWAVCLPRDGTAALGPLRRRPAIRVLELPDCVWLRGESLDDALAHELRKLPGAQRFALTADDQIIAVSAQVPHGYLPTGDWQPLASWLTPDLPLAALPGVLADKAMVTLVRTTAEREANVLRATLAEWQEHAATAPEVRLQRWMFAVNEHGDVLIRGAPLPPIPGQRFVDRERIAVPAGWIWSPPVDAAVLARLFDLGLGDLVVMHPNGEHELIRASSFVRAEQIRGAHDCRGYRPWLI